MFRLFNPKAQGKAVKKVNDHYLILSLIEAQPDLCDLIICDEQMKNGLGTPYIIAKSLENQDGSLDGDLVFKKILDTIVNQ